MRLVRSDWIDQYIDGAEAAVMVGNQVVVLSELATALVVEVGECGASLGSVQAALTSAFGEPAIGDAVTAIDSVVSELVSLGLLKVIGHPDDS